MCSSPFAGSFGLFITGINAPWFVRLILQRGIDYLLRIKDWHAEISLTIVGKRTLSQSDWICWFVWWLTGNLSIEDLMILMVLVCVDDWLLGIILFSECNVLFALVMFWRNSLKDSVLACYYWVLLLELVRVYCWCRWKKLCFGIHLVILDRNKNLGTLRNKQGEMHVREPYQRLFWLRDSLRYASFFLFLQLNSK